MGDNTYKGTQGLWELMTRERPDEEKYDDKDHDDYREILCGRRMLLTVEES